MNEQDLTPWFPATVNPVHEGLYEVRYGQSPLTAQLYWAGERWQYRGESLEPLWSQQHQEGDAWRGLAKEPK